jgi:TonB family protein
MPDKELEAGHSGRVTLALRIAANGTIAEVGVFESSGWPALDASAVAAARAWSFQPARNGADEAVESRVRVPISFDASPAPMARADAPAEPAGPSPIDVAKAMTCAEFVADVDRRAVPDAKAASEAQPQFDALVGLAFGMAMLQQDGKAGVALVSHRAELFTRVVAACRAVPGDRLVPNFEAASRALLAQ